jgi:hypothetical protein
MSEAETYDKDTYLERKEKQVRAQIIRESYEKMAENVILSGIQGRIERGISGKINDLV